MSKSTHNYNQWHNNKMIIFPHKQ
uniref:Uncharacterized protein n=1 Tax=Rhizophora mucronata TaxID=61149 RepID=A0A2P2NMQ6_RHIMU